MGNMRRLEKMYGGYDGDKCSNVYRSTHQLEMCGYGPDEIHPVSVREAAEGEQETHWGWESSEDRSWSMIWPHLTQLEMCFTYGIEAAESSGSGRRVRLVVDRTK